MSVPACRIALATSSVTSRIRLGSASTTRVEPVSRSPAPHWWWEPSRADVGPKAPVHVLIIPKKVIPTLNDISDADRELIGELFRVASRVMNKLGHTDYRTVFNCGEKAQQTVFHLHLHCLAGRAFTWPPG